jgi:transposase
LFCPHAVFDSQARGFCRSRPLPPEATYKERHLIENFFAKLKQFRAIAT